ncbi:hypothetical protein K402DRAFT_423985 [Aulographum hederae CBS 113979]|uniref:Autophagy-related protein 14 n=1 Tax=Aulographum hederae CBS 113979 TaxID=1176131 RepID=A0A6G1GQX4_9PEZI|nr:hypothetical protein K402DRAFT_423985 [Aulographum hederae CBS 113979]
MRPEGSGHQDAVNIPPRQTRTWLYPYNRRLRHLHGITIRNLSLSETTTRSHGKTIDDEALPYAKNSPAKILAHRESKKVEHSRSISDLRSITEAEAGRNAAAAAAVTSNATSNATITASPRPPFRKLRRRSTLEWSGASPQARQKKLEDVTSSRMADVFYSLHVEDDAEPVYVSEVAKRTMNPNFRFFDLGGCAPSVTRQDVVTVKVFTKTEQMQDYQYFVELHINLRSLQYVGKSLDTFKHPLPQNCILFHLTDGIYTSFMDNSIEDGAIAQIPKSPKGGDTPTLPSSSYDALMKLSTLDDCIQDALATREKLNEEINDILADNSDSLTSITAVPEAKKYLRDVESAVTMQKRQVETARRKRLELQTRSHEREMNMKIGREAQARSQEDMDSASEKLKSSQNAVQQLAEDITGQRRRIVEDLSNIYPIEPIPHRSLAFTIRGLPLPNSEFEDVNEDVVAAALGHVALVLHRLSFYLSLPLPYPIQPNSSTSVIQDPISMTTGHRNYPLFMKNTVRYRFEYGVFLLNKDIEVLANSLGLRTLDIRQTLPNLKYLLYIATAGKGELPARKAGGIRGLLRRPDSAPMSRQDSQDSTAGSLMDVNRTTVQASKLLTEVVNGQKERRERGGGLPASNGQVAGNKNSVAQKSRLGDVT